jgi:hypothetical protein
MNQDTLAHRFAEYFRDRPNRWVDGRALAEIAGAYAWRTRVSDLRRPPFRMEIQNRRRTIATTDGRITISEYRFVPAVAQPQPLSLL